ncbi:sensor histidine kinase [Streptomyces sp. NBC_01304]|uniref:sensor histidine kinase n=1 Tax=Streptomyces sp. NBC_01304 TaxID=2903818 RepID=UPI002E13D67F|nr:sensor histidine kinase [Streptomyces sp. NBC_01304]
MGDVGEAGRSKVPPVEDGSGSASGAGSGVAAEPVTQAAPRAEAPLTDTRRIAAKRERVFDVVVAAVVGALVLTAAAFGDAGPLDYVLIATGCLPLAFHRSAPRVVLAAATLALAAYVLHAHPGTVAAVPVVGAAHTAARAGRRGLAALASGGFLAVYLAAGGAVGQTLLLTGWFLCALVTGLADKNWQAYLRQTEQRALDAERTREEVALRRAGEERLRIARELHDSLTHSISIVKLQAGVAVHLARKRGDDVPPALLAIQEASGEAMRELRATLDVLREPAPAGRIDELVERARSAGLAVRLTAAADLQLPDDVHHVAYRIVQEALTNAARHASPTEVTVTLAAEAKALDVRVDDDGRAVPDSPVTPGTGLTGMRERVTALGGTLHTGPRPEGGFAVHARLPLYASTLEVK